MGSAFLIALAAAPLAAQPATAVLEVEISNLRNRDGQVHVCLTGNPRAFPDCSADPDALKQTVGAGVPLLRFNVKPGRYALTAFHDENANRKLDSFLGIPREGFGFSRNPKVRFGAPKFEQVDIELGSGFSRHAVRMQYLL